MLKIYSKSNCANCIAAKQFLNQRGVAYEELMLDIDFTREQLVEQFPLARQYPIVVLDGLNIGGFSELIQKFPLIENQIRNERSLLNG